jgi:hypothetical protein
MHTQIFTTLGQRKVTKPEAERKKEEKIMSLIVATTFATQPVYNVARAAHTLRSDQNHVYSPKGTDQLRLKTKINKSELHIF